MTRPCNVDFSPRRGDSGPCSASPRCGHGLRQAYHLKGNQLILLSIRQAEMPNRHVYILRDLGLRPAVYFFDSSCWAVSGLDRHPIDIPRIVEVHELLQTLDVAVMEELLLEVRAWASVVGHCGGTRATSRAVIVCILPSETAANCLQAMFGLGAEPKPLLRKVPNPKSV
jgi:hypothetical protein